MEQQWNLVASLHRLSYPRDYGKKKNIPEDEVHSACPVQKRQIFGTLSSEKLLLAA
jgi:hypothetical protein